MRSLVFILIFGIFSSGCASVDFNRAYLKKVSNNAGVHEVIPLKLMTKDHHSIAANHYYSAHAQVVILAHGFFNNKDAYLFQEIAQKLSEFYDVISFDFRGHGKSNGLFTWSTYESQDIEAVIQYAKEHKYKKIGVMGFSLGAAIALVEASHNKDINSVIAVSAPEDVDHIDFHFWEREMLQDIKLNIGYKGRNKGVRPGNPFMRKIKPIDVVSKISPTPVLFIHGEKDWLIKPYHSERLFAAAKEPKRLMIIPEAGHAEKIYDDYPEKFINACKEWFDLTLMDRE